MPIHFQTTPIAPAITLRTAATTHFTTRQYTVVLRVPLARKTATATAMLPGLLKRGSAVDTDARQIHIRAENLHGAAFAAMVQKKGEEQLLQFTLETTRDVPVREAFLVLRDILLRPLAADGAFHTPYVDAAREALRQQIAARANNKRIYARLRCLEEMCREEPFGVHGDGYAEDLDALTAVGLFAHYNEIINKAPVEIITVGDCSEAEAAFGASLFDFPSERFVAAPTKPAAKRLPPTKPKPKPIAEAAAVAQGKLCIGLRAAAPQKGQAYYALLVANAIFGGGGDSKLFAHLREKAQLCYYVHSIFYRFTSILLIESGIASSDFAKAETLMAEQSDHMRKGNITAQELDKAKRALSKHFRGLADTPSALSDFMLSQALADEALTPEEAAACVEAVTEEACKDAFANIFVDTIYRLTDTSAPDEFETSSPNNSEKGGAPRA